MAAIRITPHSTRGRIAALETITVRAMLLSSASPSRPIVSVRTALYGLLAVAAAVVLGSLVWQGITASGAPDPTASHLSHHAVVLNTALLVFREGLEAILVLSAIVASFRGANLAYRRPVAAG